MAPGTIAAIEELALRLVKANPDGKRDPLDDLMDFLTVPKPPKKPTAPIAPTIVDVRVLPDKPED